MLLTFGARCLALSTLVLAVAGLGSVLMAAPGIDARKLAASQEAEPTPAPPEDDGSAPAAGDPPPEEPPAPPAADGDEGPQPTQAPPENDEGPQPTPAAPESDDGADDPALAPAGNPPSDEQPGEGDQPQPTPAAPESDGEESPPEAPAGEEAPADAPEANMPDESAADDASAPAEKRASKAAGQRPERLPGAELSRPAPIKPAVKPEADTEESPARPSVDAATLKGVKPGQTTRAQLHEAWGSPKRVEKIPGGLRETYEVEPFDRVRVTILDDVIESLSIYLSKAVPVEAMARQLELGDLEPVEIQDDNADVTGVAYPERGVMLGFAPNVNPPRVFQIVAEPIDAEMFLARAEQRMALRFADAMADLTQALELEADLARVHALHAELALRGGDLAQAHAAAESLAKDHPEAAEYRLLWARVLMAEGDYAQALRQVRDVIESTKAGGVTLARAYLLWGDCLARGEKHDYDGAIKLHQKAIKLAEPEAMSRKLLVRRGAKELMVDAHLAVAHDIGWGHWQQKPKAVAKWIDHARAFSDDLVTGEHAGDQWRLRYCEGAIEAMAGISQPPDVTRLIVELKQRGKKLYDSTSDEMCKAEIAWRMGRALADATEVEAARRRFDQALELGRLSLKYFDQGGIASQQLPLAEQIRGRLLFRLGSLYAVQRGDHKQAVSWFDQAVPRLESPVPDGAIDSGKLGETFVSMAVSYWEQSGREEAVRLTSQGVKFMEQAVYQGTLDAAALAIPYGNLAAMHEQLGDAKAARRYAEMASRHEHAATE